MKQETRKISNPLIFFRRLTDEGGMTLIEILTSMVVFLVVSSGIAGTMIIGLRSTAEAQIATMGKAVAQKQIEEMKARPFYVPFTNDENDGTTADVDMLDVYYPDADPGQYGYPGDWEGWYTESGGDAYYTMVSPADDRGMVKTVETRFIDSSGNVLVPAATYNSNGLGYDYPPSYLVEVTVTTTWTARDGEDSFQLVSRVSGTDQTIEDADVPDDNPGDDDSDDESDDDECDVESNDGESDDESDNSADNASGDEEVDEGDNSEDDDVEDTDDDGNSDDGSTDEENCDNDSNDGESDDDHDEDSNDNESRQ